MAKKYFEFPSVLLTGIGGGEVIIDDPSSGQGNTDDFFPCEYAVWVELFAVDYNGNGGFDFDDYRQWWINNNFDTDLWAEINPGKPLNP